MLALVRRRDDTGKLDTEVNSAGETVPAVLFDADLAGILTRAVRSIETGRPGVLRPVLRRAHDLAHGIAEQAVLDALEEAGMRLKRETVNLT